MAVADSAASLQDHMQRAAATRGTDATAAEAIERLKAFRREGVGAVRVGATGPMWAAMREEEAAGAALADARRIHADYLDREARLEEASHAHLAAHRRHAAAEAALARRDADDLAARASRATALAAAHPRAPAALATRDELADEVAAALQAWRRRPAPVALTGPSAAELQQQLAALPSVPEGDRRPDRSVLDATRALDLAEEALRLHVERPPVSAPPSPTSAAGTLRLPAMLGAAGVGGLGLILIAAGQTLTGVVLAAVALVVATWAWSSRSPAIGANPGASAECGGHLGSPAPGDRRGRGGADRRAGDPGHPVEGDLRAATAAYEAACAERDDLARAAAGAEGLNRAIEARLAAEDGAARAAEAAAAIDRALQEAAQHIGREPGDESPESLAASLAAWQGRRAEMARASEVAIREWQELQGLLGGRSLTDLQDEAARRTDAAAGLTRNGR